MKKILRAIIILVGIGIGPAIVAITNYIIVSVGIPSLSEIFLPWAVLLIYFGSAFFTGLIFLFASRPITEKITAAIAVTNARISALPSGTLFSGTVGLIIGLIISFLITAILRDLGIPWLTVLLSILTYIIVTYICIGIAVKKKSDIRLFGFGRKKGEQDSADAYISPKILDTSVIIDGRIFDIFKTGFVEGDIIVPQFVLNELRHISDSQDALRRKRGRRGLDILNKMRQELTQSIIISDTDYEDIAEVDAKLLRMAKEIGGHVITNDYNLNKVAAVSGVPVLNINELSNAVKAVFMSGEDLTVQIIRDGKEAGQGIAYLDDGTMIVVEDGYGRTGETLRVTVTSVLQTAAGRMIFAKKG